MPAMPTDLTNAELLDVPLENLQPGELRRAFTVHAEHTAKLQAEAQEHQLAVTKTAKQQETKDEEEHDALMQRETLLLDQIAEREEAILEEARALDDRTIKLKDGRRVYVDGNNFRDAEGRELQGTDRAQAEVRKAEQPHAATWEEHEDIRNRLAAEERLHDKVKALQASGGDDEQALATYEKESDKQTTISKREAAAATTDYGNGDYLAAYGLSGNFRQAVSGPSGAATPVPATAVSAPKAAVPAL